MVVWLSAVVSSSSIEKPVIHQGAVVGHTPVADQRPVLDHQPMVDLSQENGVDQSASANDVLDHVEVIVRQFLVPKRVS